MVYEGNFDGKGKSFAIVCGRFNEFITSKLLDGAWDALLRHNVSKDDVDVIWVPGAFEIPLVAQRLASSNKYSAIITLGAVIRGATPHFDYVSAEVSKGIANASMTTGVPVIFGVLTTNSIEEAVERAGTKAGNKGFDAAVSAIEMSNLFEKF